MNLFCAWIFSFCCSLYLSFLDHVHCFVTLDCALGCRVGTKPKTWTHPSFTCFWQQPFCSQISNRSDVAAILIDIDDTGWRDVCTAQNFAEISFGFPWTARLIQEKVNCLASRIYCPIKLHPFATNLDIGLINTPGIVRLLQIEPASFVNFRRIFLDPSINSRVIDWQSSVGHHFF